MLKLKIRRNVGCFKGTFKPFIVWQKIGNKDRGYLWFWWIIDIVY